MAGTTHHGSTFDRNALQTLPWLTPMKAASALAFAKRRTSPA
jgi:hypothetical protein